MTLTTLRLSKRGGQICYRESGAGEPLVLLHGVGMQSAAWLPQIKALQDRYRLVALDLPGHGGSDPLPNGSPLEAFVDWCQKAVEALGLEEVNLAGHSMGAMIAGGFAVAHPSRTKRVALLNGVFRRSQQARAAVVARANEIAQGQIDHESPLSRWFSDQPADCHVRTDVAAWLQAVDPVGYTTAYAAFARGDATYADCFSQIVCPFLALTGQGDPNSTPEMAEEMAKAVQNGRAVVIPGHRHMANLTAAEQVNEHLAEWLLMPHRAKELQS